MRALPHHTEQCHTIPYEKGVCCSYLGVRVQCTKCHSWVWPQEKWACCGDGKRVLMSRYNPSLDKGYKALLKGPLSMCPGGLCLCAQGGSVYVPRGALSMCAGCTAHVRRVHCSCAQGALLMCAGCIVHVRRVHCPCARAGMYPGGHHLCAQGGTVYMHKDTV